jgi:hypothetical protein
VRDLVAVNTDVCLNSVQDVFNLVEPQTRIRLNLFSKDDVEKIRTGLPKLNSLVGAFKIHYLSIDVEGNVMSKILPNDLVTKVVYIRPSWRQFGNRVAAPEITVFDETEV